MSTSQPHTEHPANSPDEVAFLRHAVATLSYRSAKALRDAPPDFALLRASPSSRTPVEILAHMGDLLDWALSIAAGQQKWDDSKPLPWEQEVARYFQALADFDDYLSAHTVQRPVGRIFQGGIADALTHTGQLTLLRGIAGAPVIGENYYVADIEVGRVGREQSPPRREFFGKPSESD